MRRRLPSPIRPFEVVPLQLVVAAKRIFSVWWALNAATSPGEEACSTSEQLTRRHPDLQLSLKPGQTTAPWLG